MTPKYVICCGMRRSGSTMQYRVAKAIIDAAHADCKVLKAHRLLAEQKELITGGNTKCLYIYRDIRDVIVSELNLNRLAFSFTNVCGSDIIDDVLPAYREWMTVEGIYTSRYETVMADLKAEVSRIADCLQCDIGADEIDLIARQNSIESTKKNLCEKGAEADKLVLDRSTLLFNRHIHSGESGQYRAAMSGLQIAFIETLSYEWLVSSGYPVSISRSFHVMFRPVASLLYSCLRLRQSRQKSRKRTATKSCQ